MTLAIDVAIESAAAALFTAPSDADRRAALATLAAAGPAVRIPLPGGNTGWLVTGYAHVRAVLSRPARRQAARTVRGPVHRRAAAGRGRGSVPAHAQHQPARPRTAAPTGRRGVHPTPGRRRWPRGSSSSPTRFLDAVPADGPVDLVEALAAPLPVRVIGDLLGVPESRLRRGSAPGHAALVTGVLAGRDAYVDAAVGMLALLRELVARRRAEPGDDLLSALVAARDGAGGRGRTGSTRTS